MSLTAASRSALSGLNMASITTRLISDNIANALTPGYGVRSVGVTSDHNGSGVRVLGITRNMDPVLLSNRRMADADLGAARTASQFMARVEDLVGLPDSDYSLSGRIAQFQTDLLEAASRPDSGIRLDQAVASASDLVESINAAANNVQKLRNDAEKDIASQVDRLNEILGSIDELNTRISGTLMAGSTAAPLLDQRQVLVDELSEMIPVREIPRENGRIALYTTGGAILLDTQAAEIEFNQKNLVTEFMSIEDGSLGGLIVNGREISTDANSGSLRGGSLYAAFEVRDVTAVEMQDRLDGLAQDLISRFEDPSVDATRGVGDPGLFTDSGSALDPTDVLGLSQRLELNTAVDPAQGGESWRLRDGLGAAAEGDPGDASLIQDLVDVMDATQTAPSAIGTGSYTASGLVDYVSSLVSSERAYAETNETFASNQQSEFAALLDAEGVDTDAELQALLVIEQLYAANAQVLQTVDQMLNTLMEL